MRIGKGSSSQDIDRARELMEEHLPEEMQSSPHAIEAIPYADRIHVIFVWAPERATASRDCTLLSVQLRPGNELWISRLQVHPEVRGRGYGKALVDTCEDFAESLRCKRIRLFAKSRARTFWRYMGYGDDPVTHRAMIKKLR